MSVCPHLTIEEIMDLCKPLVRPSSQCKYVKKLGLPFKLRADRRPLISRETMRKFLGDDVMTLTIEEEEPDFDNLNMILTKRKKKNGQAS